MKTSANAAEDGSSPRMRGTRLRAVGCPLGHGIIPADAGNTVYMGITCRFAEDHPRGCGEHKRHHMTYYTFRGSSPRMRGTPQVQGRAKARARIIPADAGNT